MYIHVQVQLQFQHARDMSNMYTPVQLRWQFQHVSTCPTCTHQACSPVTVASVEIKVLGPHLFAWRPLQTGTGLNQHTQTVGCIAVRKTCALWGAQKKEIRRLRGVQPCSHILWEACKCASPPAFCQRTGRSRLISVVQT